MSPAAAVAAAAGLQFSSIRAAAAAAAAAALNGANSAVSSTTSGGGTSVSSSMNSRDSGGGMISLLPSMAAHHLSSLHATAQHLFAQHAAAAAAAAGAGHGILDSAGNGPNSGSLIPSSFPSPAALLVHPSTKLLQTLRAAEQYQEVVCGPGPRSSDSGSGGGPPTSTGQNIRLSYANPSVATAAALISWNPTWEAVQETSARLLFMAVRWVKGLEPFQTLSKRDQVNIKECN